MALYMGKLLTPVEDFVMLFPLGNIFFVGLFIFFFFFEFRSSPRNFEKRKKINKTKKKLLFTELADLANGVLSTGILVLVDQISQFPQNKVPKKKEQKYSCFNFFWLKTNC